MAARKAEDEKLTTEGDYPFAPQFISIEHFFSDHESYQRDQRKRFIKKHATPENFKPSRVGAISVSLRPDGRYAVIDGQQRWQMLVLMGMTHVWALVYEGLSVREEAFLFVDLNFVRNNVKSWDHYKAARTAEDLAVLGVDELCASFGFTVTGEGSRFDTFGCCRTLLDIYTAAPEIYRQVKDGDRSNQLTGPQVLREIFTLIDMIWRRGLLLREWRYARSSALLAGLGRFFFANPGVTAVQLATAFSGSLPGSIVLQADGNGGGHGRGVEEVIQQLWEDRIQAPTIRASKKKTEPSKIAVSIAAA